MRERERDRESAGKEKGRADRKVDRVVREGGLSTPGGWAFTIGSVWLAWGAAVAATRIEGLVPELPVLDVNYVDILMYHT